MCLIRVANEIHSSATKKNKEWQVKLPVVVFKAEEILYSKANSEVLLPNFTWVWLLGSWVSYFYVFFPCLGGVQGFRNPL